MWAHLGNCLKREEWVANIVLRKYDALWEGKQREFSKKERMKRGLREKQGRNRRHWLCKMRTGTVFSDQKQVHKDRSPNAGKYDIRRGFPLTFSGTWCIRDMCLTNQWTVAGKQEQCRLWYSYVVQLSRDEDNRRKGLLDVFHALEWEKGILTNMYLKQTGCSQNGNGRVKISYNT